MTHPVQFTYVRDLSNYAQACDTIAKSPRLALDSETYTKVQYNNQLFAAAELRTNPHTGAVSLLQVMTDPTVGGELFVFDIVCLKACNYNPQLLHQALASTKYIVAQNSKFDAAMLSEEIGWLENWHCTYVLAQIYANATGSKLWQGRGMNLRALCRDWLGITLVGKGTTQIEEWYCEPASRTLANPNWLVKLQYAASDVQYLFKIHDILYYLCAAPFPQTALIKTSATLTPPYGLGMNKAVELEFSLIPVIAKLEVQGLPFNPMISSKFKAALDTEVTTAAIYICEQLELGLTTDGLWGEEVPDPQSLKTLNNPVKLLALTVAKTGLNLSSSQAAIFRRASEVLTALAKADILGVDSNLESIDSEAEVIKEMDALSTSAKQAGLELLDQILKYKKLSKQQSMLLDRFANPQSARIHPRFDSLRASTSRFACSRP